VGISPPGVYLGAPQQGPRQRFQNVVPLVKNIPAKVCREQKWIAAILPQPIEFKHFTTNIKELDEAI